MPIDSERHLRALVAEQRSTYERVVPVLLAAVEACLDATTWTPCAARQPDVGPTWFLVFTDEPAMVLARRVLVPQMTDDGKDEAPEWCVSTEDGEAVIDVTHWRPFPSPPSDETNQESP